MKNFGKVSCKRSYKRRDRLAFYRIIRFMVFWWTFEEKNIYVVYSEFFFQYNMYTFIAFIHCSNNKINNKIKDI